MVLTDKIIHVEDRLFNIVEYEEALGEYSLHVKDWKLSTHIRESNIPTLAFLTMKELVVILNRIKLNDYELGLEAEIFIANNSTKRGE